MKKLIGFLFLVPAFLVAEVGLIPAGQSMWWISKRIGETADVIDSKLDSISATCEATVLSSSDISGGTITISSAGLYCLSEDVTANISVEASCVSLNLNNRTVTGSILFINATVTDCAVFNGFVEASSSHAIRIENSCNRILVMSVTASGGNNGAAINLGSVTNIFFAGCYMQGGNVPTSFASAAAGIAIAVTSSSDILIKNCVGLGGNGADGTNGADGGHGIQLSSATRVEIDGCIIFKTGNGGDGSNTNGDGGDGIFIASDCVDTAVHDCIIRNTGSAGSGGGAAGADGKAFFDDVPLGANESIVYRNVAHNIANTIKYELHASSVESGVSMTNPPTNIPRANQFINFYM